MKGFRQEKRCLTETLALWDESLTIPELAMKLKRCKQYIYILARRFKLKYKESAPDLGANVKPCQNKGCRRMAYGRAYYCEICRKKAERVSLAEVRKASHLPLADSEFPAFSRGWFRAQLAAGLSAEAMAFHTRKPIYYIKAELAFMPREVA